MGVMQLVRKACGRRTMSPNATMGHRAEIQWLFRGRTNYLWPFVNFMIIKSRFFGGIKLGRIFVDL